MKRAAQRDTLPVTSVATVNGNVVGGPDVERCVKEDSRPGISPSTHDVQEDEAMTPTITPPPEATAPPAAEERCDRCNAAGKLRVVLAGGGELIFCGHHANKFAPDLVKIAVETVAAPDFDWRGTESTELLSGGAG
jgi:hypothetical protein